jgi:hypothetical protein
MFLANLIKNHAPRTYAEILNIQLERFTDVHKYGYLEGLDRTREVFNSLVDLTCECKKKKPCKYEVLRVLVNNAIDGEIEETE